MALTATIIISNIPNQAASAPFQVTWTYQLNETTWTDQLVFIDDGGNQTPIASPGVNLGISSCFMNHAAMAPGSHTISISDPLTGTVATSNVFTVGTAQVITPVAPSGAVAGAPVTFTGTLTNYATAPALTYSLNGATPVPMTGVTNTGWTLSLTIAAAGNYTLVVSDGSINSAPVTFTVAPSSTQHVITPSAPTPVTGSTITAGAVVNFTGTLTGYFAAPSLTFALNNAQPVAMTGVTATGWSMQFTAPVTPGAYQLNVTDGTTNGSVQFQVGAAARAITPIAPNSPVAGQSFTFTGVLAGYTTIPALTYALNGGAPTPLTGVSVTGWATTLTIPTAGTYAVLVADGTGTTGSVSFVVRAPNIALRNWATNPGMDGSFWVQPIQNTANFITSGPLVTALRSGTPSVNVKGNFAQAWYNGGPTDPLVTVTDGTHTIVVHVPLGATVETPTSQFDQSIGGTDATQPYLWWSISGASINTGSVQATGSIITGTFSFCVEDGSGLIFIDAVTGIKGLANAAGGINDYELQQATNSAAYVIQHMLAYQMDNSFQTSLQGPIWPLAAIDSNITGGGGPIPQGLTLAIPPTVVRPTGMSRGKALLWDCCQQFGIFFYNQGGTGGLNITCFDFSGAFGTLVADIQASWPSVVAQLCILNYDPAVAGSQFSLATTKGAVPGSVNAFPAPPPLDLSPTGGVNVMPSTFGAWYPSGYNAIPTNSTTTVTFSVSPNAPVGAVVNVAFTFSGSLQGYSAAPTLTYSVDGGTPLPLSGITSIGWSTLITISGSGNHTITVTDALHQVSGATSFNVSSGVLPPPSAVTWNPADLSGGITLSNGNYTATAGGSTTPGAAHQGVRATATITGTKVVVWEVTANTVTQDWASGVASATFGLAAGGGLGADATGLGAYISTGTGSQPAQTVYYNAAQLTAGNGVSSTAGAVNTFATNGTSFWFSNAAMRSTSGVQWNNSATANPATGSGGFPFAGIGATYYPVFNSLEGGSSATLNDGTVAFSSFATAFLATNPTAVTLSGQAPPPPGKTIVPVTPGGVVVNTPFTFSGNLTGYATAPTLTYSINGQSPIALQGVTATGWSTTLTITGAGSGFSISVTDGSVVGSTSTFSVTTGGTGAGRVVAPLTGAVTTGTWLLDQKFTLAGSPSGKGYMNYNILLPAQYDPSGKTLYPLFFWGHPLDDGMKGAYPRAGSDFVNAQSYGTGLSIDSVFNSVQFRTAHPCIIVAPECDQTIDLSGSNGNSNFGGYSDSQNSGWNERAVNGIAQFMIQSYPIDPAARYLAGTSLGAIGLLSWLVDNNQLNGPSGLNLWTAGIGMSEQLFRPATPNSQVFGRMTNVPYLAISTPSDNVPSSYDQPAWQFYTGNTNYPVKSAYDSGGMAAIRAGSSQFYYIAQPSGSPWNTFMAMSALNGDGDTMYRWLFNQFANAALPTITGVSFAPVASILANSAVGTVVGQLTVGAANGSLTGVTYALSSTAQFKVTTTGQVQFNSATVAAGSYALSVTVTATNASNTPQTFGFSVVVTSPVASGVFSIAGGAVIAPNGAPWVGRGVALHDSDFTTWVSNAACQPLLTLWPRCNMVRIAAFSYWSPSTYAQQIAWLTAKQIVVVLEDHTNSTGGDSGGGQGVVYTGAQLTAELNWYAALATAFIGNTYVWFGTDNEPSFVPSLSALYTWQQQTYNAIRATGSQAIIEIETPNPFLQGALGGVSQTTFSAMHNIVLGPHFYSWIWGGQATNVSQATIYSSAVGSTNSKYGGIVQQIANLRFFTSADGVIPVGCFEFGPSTTGLAPIDVSGNACVAAVIQAVNAGDLFCFNAWAVNTSAGDLLNNGTTSLTTWGQTVATAIATNPNPNVPTTTKQFINLFGVNTHIDNSSTVYFNNPTAIKTAMATLGLNQVRNPLNTGYNTTAWNSLVAGGITVDTPIVASTPTAGSATGMIAAVNQLVTANPGSVSAIEGANEVVNNPVNFNGTTGIPGANLLQQSLWSLTQADPQAVGVPVYMYTFGNGNPSTLGTGNQSAFANFGNAHIYPSVLIGGGITPYTCYVANIPFQVTPITPNLPSVITETGYYTSNVNTYGVNNDVQMRYILDAMFDTAVLGVHRCYIYELFDNQSDPGNTNSEFHFGLFNSNFTPKPAATAIHNLTTILADAGTATTGPTPYSVSGLPNAALTLGLAMSGGRTVIAVWNEPVIWNQTTHTQSAATPVSVTITLPKTFTTVQVYDPIIASTVQTTLSNVSTVTVSVTDHPILIKVTP